MSWGDAIADLAGRIPRSTPLEIAEMLWLAARVIGAETNQTPDVSRSPTTAPSPSEPTPPLPRVEAVVAGDDDVAGPTPGLRGAGRVRLPPLAEPSGSVRMARALHRLGQREARGRTEVDVGHTVRRSAEIGLTWIMHRRQTVEVMHLVVLVDPSGQLAPWVSQIEALVAQARASGRFPRVTRVDLNLDAGTAPQEDLARSGRTGCPLLVLVITDGLHPGVTDGRLEQVLRRLQGAPRAVWVHPWGPPAWSETPLGALRPSTPRPLGAGPPDLAVVPFSPDGLARLEAYANGRTTRGLRGARLEPVPLDNTPGGLDQLAAVPAQLLALSAAVPGWLDLELWLAMGQALTTRVPNRLDLARVLASGMVERVPDVDPPMWRFRLNADTARADALRQLPRERVPELIRLLVRHMDDGGAGDLGIPVALLRALGDGAEELPVAASADLNGMGDLQLAVLRDLVTITGWRAPWLEPTSAQWAAPPGDHTDTANSHIAIEYDPASERTATKQVHRRGKTAEPPPYSEPSLAIQAETLGTEHPDTAVSLYAVGQALASQGKYAEALAYFERDLAITEKTLGTEHPDTAISLYTIGQTLASQGKYAEALGYFERDLAITEKTLGTEHPNAATTLNAIGQALANQGKHAEALGYFERDLAITEKTLGTEHPDAATTLNAIGQALASQGKYTEALGYHERSLAIQQRVLGTEHLDTATTLNAIGQVLVYQGSYAEALACHYRSLKIQETALGTEHPSLAITLNGIGNAVASQGRYADALTYYERDLAITEKTLGTEHPSTASTLNAIGQALASQGKHADALSYFERALAIWEKTLGTEHPETAITLNAIGEATAGQGKYNEAIAYYERSLAIKSKALGAEHPETARTLHAIGQAVASQGKYDEALTYYELALTIQEKSLGTTHPSTASTQDAITQTVASRQAEDAYRELVETRHGIKPVIPPLDERMNPIRGGVANLPRATKVHNLPPQTLDFIGRYDELARIHALVVSDRAVAISQVTSVSGPGGIGKTQLALRYALLYANEFDAVLWVDAAGEAVTTAFAGLCETLRLSKSSTTTVEERAAAVREVLESGGPKLLVLDNVDHFKAIKPHLPRRGPTRVLMTTRLPEIPGAKTLRLDVLPPEDALRVLLGERIVTGGELVAAQKLCAELQYLTGALANAREVLQSGLHTHTSLLAQVRLHSRARTGTPPRVFISYAWDAADDAWGEALATRLRADGVDAQLDRWLVHPGEDLTAFMETQVRESAFVLFICTPRYKTKAENRSGGAGYETMIATAEVLSRQADVARKFIPVHRSGAWKDASPSWLLGRYRIDLTADPYSEANYADLLNTLLGRRLGPPPVAAQAKPDAVTEGAWPNKQALTEAHHLADCRQLETLFSNTSIRRINEFLEHAHSTQIRLDLLNFYEGFRHVAQSPSFHPTDAQLRARLQEFTGHMDSMIKRSEWFRPASNPMLQVFNSRDARSHGSDPAEAATQWRGWALSAASAWSALLQHVRADYPEVNLERCGEKCEAFEAAHSPIFAPTAPPAAGPSRPSPAPTPKAAPSPSRRVALQDLFLKLFNPQELRRFVAYLPGGDDLEHELPTGGSPAEYSFALTRALESRGMVDGAFFDALLAERPRRASDIGAVRKAWSA